MASDAPVAANLEKGSKKRKRETAAEDELEINVNLPEPPSKKALRKAKRGKNPKVRSSLKDRTDLEDDGILSDAATPIVEPGVTSEKTDGKATPVAQIAKRSDFGIWIGNLGFHVTPAILSEFLCVKASLKPEQLTRINLPLSAKPLPTFLQRKSSDGKTPKQQMQNKGFAYVDLDTADALFQVLQVTESDLDGRKVLIKDAKSFAGRPDPPPKAESKAGDRKDPNPKGAKAPSKRIFVGNLSFDVTKDELREHFEQAGVVEDVFLTTFQDTGKCKGFGWVTFADTSSAEKAVQGWVWKLDGDADDNGDSAGGIARDTQDAAPANGAKASSNSDDDQEGDSDVEVDSSSDNDVDIKVEKRSDTHAPKGAPKLKPPKKRKWWINKVYGRMLRCEFAEDPTTRYKKRFKASSDTKPSARSDPDYSLGADAAAVPREGSDHKRKERPRGTADERLEARRQKHKDARKVAPGQALANAPRQSGAIVAAKGKKVSFD